MSELEDRALAGIMRTILRGERNWEYGYVAIEGNGLIIDGSMDLEPLELEVVKAVYGETR